MQFNATAKYIRFSPYKLRPLVDVVRGKSVVFALQWLSTYAVKRAKPIAKVLESAVANAISSKGVENPENLIVKEIRVDQGPIIRYFKPGAMGRANPQTKRLSHINVVLMERENPKKKKSVKRKGKVKV